MAHKPSSAGLSERGVRGWLSNLLELAEVRFELFTVEARIEVRRLVMAVAFALVGALMAAFGLVFLAVFITVALWQTHALLALGIFTAVFLGGGGVLVWLARGTLGGIANMFSATREELRRDTQRLRGESS